ncbi:MAG TPA: hypothetical protein VK308_07560 [Pyrinomonadaceae bacterium]|nr:hypothetical protein [Pyrinomonadaceae bacterium]
MITAHITNQWTRAATATFLNLTARELPPRHLNRYAFLGKYVTNT